ncbi:MAG: MG2 domain-containing protein [Defluviitaleaceae bacterium]|nr:MG2 domain-containing protein [Defluviitaleaceae bacterium]
MARKTTRYILAGIIIFICLFFVYQRGSNFIAARRAAALPGPRHQLTLTTNRTYYTDTAVVAAVQVRDLFGQPLQAELDVHIIDFNANRPGFDNAIFSTNYSGSAVISLPMDATGSGWYSLSINVSSELGEESFIRDIYITQPEGQNHIIHFDKGLYKPGDDVLFRILAVNSNDATPFASGDYVISIFDGNDNRVFMEEATTSDFGIMSGRFRLGDEVNSGFYRLLVERDGVFQAQAQFEVSPYVLPKFEIVLSTDRNQYHVEDDIYITGYVRYFFGEPVNQGHVTVTINGEQVLDRVDLNEDGSFHVTHRAYMAGIYTVFVEVIDNSNYRVEETMHVRVAEGPFVIELLPEHGYLVQGLPNRVYIFTNRADGSPVRAHLQVSGQAFSRQVATDDNGMGFFILEDVTSRNDIIVRGVDMDDNDIHADFRIPGQSRNVTLSTDRPRYTMGDAIHLSLHSQERGGSFVIYAYRNNQLLQILITEQDTAELYLGDVYGLIDIYAMWIGPNDNRDYEAIPFARKTVFVDPGRFMHLTVDADRPEYRPGEFVNLNIGVTDSDGMPLDAALLVSIVDEAMLSLAANDLSIDNIRLALADIRFSEGLDAATLYATLISGASEQAISRLLLRQGGISPSIQTSRIINPPPRAPEQRGSGVMTAFLVYVVFVATIMFFVFRDKPHLSPTHHHKYPDIPGYLQNKSPSTVVQKDEKAISWVVLGAIVIFIFALFFLSSCSSARDSEESMADRIPPPQTAEADDSAPASEPSFDLEDADDAFEAPGRPAGEIETQTARVRRLFLETMLFIPEVMARDGQAELGFMLADNITTWNIQVVGNTQDGLVGHTEGSIRAFQPFFMDFELPRNSIRGDRVSIPVTVFNYTEEEQIVILTIAELPWFTLNTEPVQTLTVPVNQSVMVYIPITILDFGDFVFRAYADTHGFADAVEKGLRVNPEGFRIERVVSSGTIERDIMQHILFMDVDIPDTRRATIKFYPSVMAQVVEGMENIFRMPFGCFEQTSSILFPNILALRYMQENNLDNPAITSRALEFISSGYQRLLTFEVRSEPGGFSLFGHAPAETVLTAYGLMQLVNLTSVYTIDERVMERMAEFMFSHQNRDGSFNITGPNVHRLTDAQHLAFNAYIIWAMSEAIPRDSRLQISVDYLLSRLHLVDDNFTLALIANALVNVGSPQASDVLADLAGNVERIGDSAYVSANLRDYFGTSGHAQNLQTTALTSLVFSRYGVYTDTNAMLVNHILANQDSWGTWHSTQATILSLMALTNHATASPLKDGEITVTIGEQEQVIRVSGDNTLDLYQVTFTGLDAENTMHIRFPDLGTMTYKITLDFYVPYDSVELDRGFEVITSMDTDLIIHQWVDQDIRVINRSGMVINNAMVVVSIPQGFRVEASSLAALRNQGLIERYETRFDVVNLYLRDVEAGEIIDLVVAYRPSYPVIVTGGHVRVFDYYNPTIEGFAMPMEIVVG